MLHNLGPAAVSSVSCCTARSPSDRSTSSSSKRKSLAIPSPLHNEGLSWQIDLPRRAALAGSCASLPSAQWHKEIYAQWLLYLPLSSCRRWSLHQESTEPFCLCRQHQRSNKNPNGTRGLTQIRIALQRLWKLSCQ